MSQFDYTLPSGSQFRVNGPANATQLQADTIFYEQVAAGSLVAYDSGQTLTSLATQVTKFDLSRLERGTAGVDTVSVLSIIQNLPVISGIPSLVEVPVQSPVNQTDIVLAQGDSLGPLSVGPLTSFQIQTLQAQLINSVDQDYNVITEANGIGKYGFTCSQLEQVGYVKPGTFSKYLADGLGCGFVDVMSSPGVWTGLGGVNSLNDLLYDSNIQNTIQNQLMQSAYNALVATGVISNVAEPSISLSQGQIYTPSGLQTLNALNILGGNAGLINGLLSQPVTNLDTIATGAIPDTALAQTAINVTNRINGEVGALINNATKFGSLATTAWANSGNLPTISSLLTGVNGLPTLSSLNINQITSGLTNVIPGNLGTLKAGLDNLAKASQFSLNFTNPLTKLNNINVTALANTALTDVQGRVTGAVTNLQGQVTGAVTNLQGQVTGAVTNLQGQLTGSFKQLTNLFSGSGDLVSGTQIAAGFSNTVNRKTVDAAVTRILGNSKIQSPNFEYPSPASVLEKLDIAQAQTILNNLKTQGQAVVGQATRIASQAQTTATQAQNTINRLI